MTDFTTPTTAWTRLAAPLPRLRLVTGFASATP
jgi:hypothetical protein